jgi:hypothetical protein
MKWKMFLSIILLMVSAFLLLYADVFAFAAEVSTRGPFYTRATFMALTFLPAPGILIIVAYRLSPFPG